MSRSRWADVRLFSTPARAPRARRPTDALQLLVCTLAVGVLALAATGEPSGFGAALTELVDAVPGALDPIWAVAVDLGLVWVGLVLLASVLRRHWGLLVDIVASAATAIAAAAVTARLVNGEWPDVIATAAGVDGPVPYPALGLALAVAVASVSAPHLARPFRYTGRWLVAGTFTGYLLAPVASPEATVGGFALGLAAAALVHLVHGSPGGRPAPSQVAIGLEDLGLDAVTVGPVDLVEGVAVVRAQDRSGHGLLVRVIGRDAWDGQFLAGLWRFLVYRDSAPSLAYTREQQIEHEAVLTLLAERRGAPVVPAVASGTTRLGDAMIVLSDGGTALADAQHVDDDRLGAIWEALDALHGAGIAHGRLTPSNIAVGTDERPRLTGLAHAQFSTSPELLRMDEAHVVTTLAIVVGVERAVASAASRFDAARLAALSAYIQPAAMPRELRRACDAADLDVDDIRAAVIAASGETPPELPRLRRITVGTVVMTVMLFVAGSALVTGLADIGLDTIVDSLREASWPLVVVAWFVAQTPRFANAFAIQAASPTALPYARVSALQFAITFVNLAMPSTAARIAVNIRFFQRAGVEPTPAAAIGALDSVTGFAAQITLIIATLLLGAGSLGLGLDDASIDTGTLLALLLVIGAAVVGVGIVFAVVPTLRHKVVSTVRAALDPLTVLHSPARLLRLYGFNVVAELLFALAMWVVLRAFDQDVSYVDVVLINEGVALFAGLMPVPGGIGVTEAALTAGFIAAGVPEATAFAAAIVSRLCTFYTPPVIGFPCFRWLQRNRYL